MNINSACSIAASDEAHTVKKISNEFLFQCSDPHCIVASERQWRIQDRAFGATPPPPPPLLCPFL